LRYGKAVNAPLRIAGKPTLSTGLTQPGLTPRKIVNDFLTKRFCTAENRCKGLNRLAFRPRQILPRQPAPALDVVVGEKFATKP
jgi:hypothetical protein